MKKKKKKNAVRAAVIRSPAPAVMLIIIHRKVSRLHFGPNTANKQFQALAAARML